jgi:hypothetical protein
MGITHNDVISANTMPTPAAAPKAMKAADLTDCGEAIPDATKRSGPTLTLSVPRTPSL